MELTAGTTTDDARARSRALRARLDPAAAAAWTLAFALVAYLALSNGGYDTIVRSQAGIAVWWIVLLGALAGILPARIGAAGWVAIGLLAAFAAWTGLAIGWSESAERSAVELGRVAAYLGVLALAISVQGKAAARHTINGLASAIGLVTLLAVLSRLHPQAFPANDHLALLSQDSARKLSYPLNYWNALAAFAALGVPLLLAVAIGARTLAGQALAAAALPLSALCIYLTISRGGVLAVAVGLVAFLALVPLRLHAIGTLLAAAAGSAVLISAASQRDALQDGAPTATAIGQGNEMLWLVLIACAGVAFLQVAMGLAARHLPRPAMLDPGRRATALRALAVLAVLAVTAVAAGVPGAVSDRWQQFKAVPGTVAQGGQDNVFSRLGAADGTGRYQFWQSALDAHASAPWQGIGPGTFEFWWARNGTLTDFVRDAHSLYAETLAETGFVGLALLVALLGWLAVVAVTRSLRAAPGLRLWIAAAAGGLAAFLTAAALEWVWEMAAIAVVALLLGAVIVAGRDDGAPRDPGADEPRARSRRRCATRRARRSCRPRAARRRRAGGGRRPDGRCARDPRQPPGRSRWSPDGGAAGQPHGGATAALRRDPAAAARARARGEPARWTPRRPPPARPRWKSRRTGAPGSSSRASTPVAGAPLRRSTRCARRGA